MATLAQPAGGDARARVYRLTHSQPFEWFIVAFILVSGVLLGLETVSWIVERHGAWLEFGQQAILGVFIVEALLKMYAASPRIDRYFRDPWNVFDFTIIVVSLVPAVGIWALVARKVRLLRVLRLISAIPELRLLVATLVRSVPGMLHIVVLMGALSYVYAIVGFQLFSEHDPVHWHNLGISLLSLFRVVTLEDWTDIMYKAMELHQMAWLYFVSYVVLGAFIIFNLFTALVINNLDEAKRERLRAGSQPETAESLRVAIRNASEALRVLEQQLEAEPGEGGPAA